MLRPIFRFALTLSTFALLGANPAAAQGDPAVSTPAVATTGYVRPAPPGRLVDVDAGRRLHVLCKGEGPGPVVIIEAGLSQFVASSTYGLLQDAVAPFARVCLYDRAGMGWSDPAPAGWTIEGMTRDLQVLKAAIGAEGRAILVGHSFGGFLARVYAKAHPDEVAGIVLVDATSDANLAEMDAAVAAIVPQLDQAISSSRPGVPVVGMPAGTAPEVSMAFTPEVLKGVKAEFEAWTRLSEAGRRPGSLGDTPLIVIRRGKASTPPTQQDLDHRAGQEALAKLSTDSVLIVAENSSHTIPLDEPQVVADAVRRMVEAVRAGRRVS